FYGAPQRYILGASESAFQDAEGNTKSAWETYIGRVLALERDERRLRRLILPQRLQESVPDWIEAVRAVVDDYADASVELAA
ncbi:hypothetical protein KBZ21_41180, partial [Streptomyces sp. A73]|nr:hypothetical protein [Streptomyces sp. A73]